MIRSTLLAAALLAATQAQAQSPAPADAALARIKRIVVIYAENRSFDHLYGSFPGADGIAQASETAKTQLGHDGKPLPYLTVWKGQGADDRFPRLPNGPFAIDGPPLNRSLGEVLPSPIHAFYHNQEQINGGANNMFAAMSTVGGWTMGHVDGSKLRLWNWARQYTLADHFFMGAFGGSFLNHQYLVCACAPTFPNAPKDIVVQLDANGHLRKKDTSPAATDGPVQVIVDGRGGQVTPDGHAVNTTQPPYEPSGLPPGKDPAYADTAGTPTQGPPLPPQTAPTIGDRLSAKGVTWAWFAGGYAAAVEDGPKAPADRKVIYKPGPVNFQAHHQPFNYYAAYAPGTPARAAHLKDGEDFLAGIDANTLPQVAFYKPAGTFTQHPSYTDLMKGDAHIADILDRMQKNPVLWNETLVIVTYDENGGFWDHVAPPKGDQWGPGTRIPAIIIGPFARKGFVDHTSYDTGSIIKLITRRFALEPLPGVRPGAGDLTPALAVD